MKERKTKVTFFVALVLLFVGSTLVAWVFGSGGSAGAQAALILGVVVLALVVWPTLIETGGCSCCRARSM